MTTETKTKRRERVEPGIYRRPDGALEIGWRDAGGKQRWRVVSGGIKAARAELATEHAKRASGERVAASPRLTFNAAADAWWEARAVRLRPASQHAYGCHLERLRERFGSRRLATITPADVVAYVTREQGAGGWTLRARLTVLSAVFAYAGRHLGHPGENPVRALERVERPSTEDEKPKRVLSDDELEKLLSAFDEHDRPFFELIAQTGVRVSEAAGLIWRNVDLDAGTIEIDAQLDPRGKRRVPTKTKNSVRTIVLPPSLVAKLREHRLRCGRPGELELVFRRRTGRPYHQADKLVRPARKRAGLEAVEAGGRVIARAVCAHDLRHTHASRLIAAGWDVAEVAARLGDSIQTVLTVYAHEWDAARRREEQRDRLAAIYGSAMEAPGAGRARSAPPEGPAEVADLRAIRADTG
jgi:integrase